jgi:hypothetical protein
MNRATPGPWPSRGCARVLIWSFLLAVILSIAGYRNVLDAYFVSDDFPNVHMNMTPQSALSQFMGSATGESPNKAYRPLISVLWMADFQVWGANALTYHLQSLLWHLAACLSLALLVHFFTRSILAAVSASSLLAVHPLHPEAVSWISARGDLMVATFLTLCLLLFAMSYVRRRWWLSAASALMFALALLSKESGLGIPLYLALFVIVYGRCWKRPQRLWRACRAALPFVAVLAGYFVIRKLALGSIFMNAYSNLDVHYRFVWIAKAFSRLVVPLNWVVFPPSWALVLAVACVLLFLFPVALYAVLARRGPRRGRPGRRILVFFSLCLAASIVPVYQILQSTDDLQGARHWYAATVWFSALAGVIIARAWTLAGRRWRVALAASTTLLLATHLSILIQNNAPWSRAGDMTQELLSRLPKTVDDDLHLETNINGLDTTCGAYILRNGLSVAIRPPFTDAGYTLLGWPPGSKSVDPPVPIAGIGDSGVIWRDVEGQRVPMVNLIFRKDRE